PRGRGARRALHPRPRRRAARAGGRPVRAAGAGGPLVGSGVADRGEDDGRARPRNRRRLPRGAGRAPAMRGIRHGLTTAWRVVRAEGLRSAVDRARDRLAERGERRRAVTVAPGGLGHAPVVNVVGMPLSSRLGGVPTQLRNRLAFESEERAFVTLSPDGAGWRLERRHRGESRLLTWGPAAFAEPAARALG